MLYTSNRFGEGNFHTLLKKIDNKIVKETSTNGIMKIFLTHLKALRTLARAVPTFICKETIERYTKGSFQ